MPVADKCRDCKFMTTDLTGNACHRLPPVLMVYPSAPAPILKAIYPPIDVNALGCGEFIKLK